MVNLGGTLRVNKFACYTFVFILFLIIYWRSGVTYATEKRELVNLKNLLKASIQVAERGGREVLEGKKHELNTKSKGKTLEGANVPVTDADYASHCVMYYALRNTFPNLAVMSEEHIKHVDLSCSQQPVIDLERGLSEHQEIEMMIDEHVYAGDVTIWMDPLDATQEYTEGLYEYVTTMVCVAVNGVPIIGVIHFPFPETRTYWVWYTKTTSSNIHYVPHKSENKNQPKVIVSRSHAGKVAELAKVFGAKTTVTPAGGSGYKVMAVVNGTYDVYLHATIIKKWDICAGDAMIKSVEGKMTTTNGDNIDYSSGNSVKVSDGILVSRFDHEYYLNKLPKVVKAP